MALKAHLAICFGSRLCAWGLLATYLLGSIAVIIKAVYVPSPNWLLLGIALAIRLCFAWIIYRWLRSDAEDDVNWRVKFKPYESSDRQKNARRR